MKKRVLLLAALIMVVLCASTAFAAVPYSDAWRQGADGVWRVYSSQGVLQKNVWFCDDAAGGPNATDNWYFLDANGNMVSAPIVRDGTGNYYSLETQHNGYYGMIRHKSGTYDGINMIFSTAHDGSFGSIQNPDAINALISRYGCVDLSYINNSNCVYSSKILGQSNPVNPTTTEYTIRYYVDGTLYKVKESTSNSMKIQDYSSSSENLLYWEDRNNGEIYYPGQYAKFTGSKKTLTLDAVLERVAPYTLTYYSNGSYYDAQSSSNGKFRILADPWTDLMGTQFVGWEDSRGNVWNHGETYTAYSRNDTLTAKWTALGNPFYYED